MRMTSGERRRSCKINDPHGQAPVCKNSVLPLSCGQQLESSGYMESRSWWCVHCYLNWPKNRTTLCLWDRWCCDGSMYLLWSCSYFEILLSAPDLCVIVEEQLSLTLGLLVAEVSLWYYKGSLLGHCVVMCSRCFCPNRARSCRAGERSRCRVGVHANLAARCCMTWWLCSYSISHLYSYPTFKVLYKWRMGSPPRRSVKCHWSLVEWSCASTWAQQVTCMCNTYRILPCIQTRVALVKQAILLPYWVTQCHERQPCSEPSNVGLLTLVDLTGFTELFSPYC